MLKSSMSPWKSRYSNTAMIGALTVSHDFSTIVKQCENYARYFPPVQAHMSTQPLPSIPTGMSVKLVQDLATTNQETSMEVSLLIFTFLITNFHRQTMTVIRTLKSTFRMVRGSSYSYAPTTSLEPKGMNI